MATGFNWHGEDAEDCIAIRSVSAVAVYVNNAGDIVIRQEGGMSDDQTVVVPVSFIPALTAAIERAVEESTANMGE
jgi:hypothetical protein